MPARDFAMFNGKGSDYCTCLEKKSNVKNDSGFNVWLFEPTTRGRNGKWLQCGKELGQ